MTIIRALFPMKFVDQPCVYRCGAYVSDEEGVPLFDTEGRFLGFHHPDCERPDDE